VGLGVRRGVAAGVDRAAGASVADAVGVAGDAVRLADDPAEAVSVGAPGVPELPAGTAASLGWAVADASGVPVAESTPLSGPRGSDCAANAARTTITTVASPATLRCRGRPFRWAIAIG
jgi:hypothetical protein